MKKLILLIFFISIFSIFSEAEEPVLLVTGNWPPYSGKSAKNFGIYSEAALIAFKKMNIPMKFEFYPWSRCEEILAKGNAFASYPYVKTEKRLLSYSFTVPLNNAHNVFFYYNNPAFNSFKNKDFKDLKQYQIGTVRGYYYVDLFKKYDLNTFSSNNDEEALNLLKARRIELYSNDLIVGLYLINKYFPNEKQKFKYFFAKQYTKKPLHYMVSKKYNNSYKIFKQFNRTLIKMKRNGEINRIIKKYK